uniref:RNA helicase n=1 Tax=Corethron hystrix TaxID=216773 RepID=A0A7S1FWL9_9STRA|mmetsp:Transcript_37897/g.88187  ORF Transcript_37897/g.88187 Transcript_37897/m.88187 type:complete len:588 (+) Transcript_37897:208-1971(+)|eukprot:CAMPEP_0113312712 /NCGR_PEP_ID=MMETSP0010_2-20120614/9437_1 /TAXON_ID=216773 ORGANISM="Corethron hystrix, Strain 308" /NCGR_SAMPLE_ID=MMETSP0010_2 /ASSEMBLY_ACC=CAM_ASM_000155 /LENGTH=587 /DNA_ID=CAMNT_0000168601 /DNA_START=49 /DNA_END=1812 /DNA_ORIENTATION=- /assembly_acc=CAM_ASM_000155
MASFPDFHPLSLASKVLFLFLFNISPKNSDAFLGIGIGTSIDSSIGTRSVPHYRFGSDPYIHSCRHNFISLHSSFHQTSEYDTFREKYSSLLPEWIIDRLEDLEMPIPTAVQRAYLDALMMEDGGEKGIIDAGGSNEADEISTTKSDGYILQSQTGSGKTLAYLLPILASIDASRSAVQAVIVVPTRELGLQVGRVARRIAAGFLPPLEDTARKTHREKLYVMTVLQGSENRRQRAWAWAESPQLVVGTPAELNGMIAKGAIRRNSIRAVVVDEADACLLTGGPGGSYDASTSRALHELLSRHLSPTYGEADVEDLKEVEAWGITVEEDGTSGRAPQERQTIFVSATIPSHRHFTRMCVQNRWTKHLPMHIHVTPDMLMPPQLDHGKFVCRSQSDRLKALRTLVKRDHKEGMTRALIFVDPRRPMERMAAALAKDLSDENLSMKAGKTKMVGAKVFVGVLRYDASLSDRAETMASFIGEENDDMLHPSVLRILLSSDLVARGLDVPDVSHIYNFDLPGSSDTYVHRGGRAGRCGKPGTVTTIVCQDEEFVLDRLANAAGIEIRCVGRQKNGRKAKKLVGDDSMAQEE